MKAPQTHKRFQNIIGKLDLPLGVCGRDDDGDDGSENGYLIQITSLIVLVIIN